MFSVKSIIAFTLQIYEMHMNKTVYYVTFYNNPTISGPPGCSVDTTGGLWKPL